MRLRSSPTPDPMTAMRKGLEAIAATLEQDYPQSTVTAQFRADTDILRTCNPANFGNMEYATTVYTSIGNILSARFSQHAPGKYIAASLRDDPKIVEGLKTLQQQIIDAEPIPGKLPTAQAQLSRRQALLCLGYAAAGVGIIAAALYGHKLDLADQASTLPPATPVFDLVREVNEGMLHNYRSSQFRSVGQDAAFIKIQDIIDAGGPGCRNKLSKYLRHDCTLETPSDERTIVVAKALAYILATPRSLHEKEGLLKTMTQDVPEVKDVRYVVRHRYPQPNETLSLEVLMTIGYTAEGKTVIPATPSLAEKILASLNRGTAR